MLVCFVLVGASFSEDLVLVILGDDADVLCYVGSMIILRAHHFLIS